MKKASIIAEGIGWPEGLRWHQGALWYSDIYGGKSVYRMTEPGKSQKMIEVPNCPSGLGWTTEGDLLIVSMDDCLLLRLPSGSDGLEVVADLSDLARVINDMVVSENGTAYISDIGFRVGEETPAMGRLLKVTPDGEACVVAVEMAMPDGMAFIEDEHTLVVAETFGGRLTQFSIGPGGKLAARCLFHAFDNLGWVTDMEVMMQRPVTPDGICADVRGAIWVGNPLAAEISCVSSSGEILDRVGLSQPGIACAVGGPEGDTLFVATGILSDLAGTQGKIESCRISVSGC